MSGLILLGLVAIATLIAWLLTISGQLILLAAFGFFALVVLIFQINEALLPVVLILTLALGSAYNYTIASKSFYLRFLVLGLIALRSFLLTMQLKGDTTQHRYSITLVHAAFFYTGLIGLLTSAFSVVPSLSAMRALSFLMLYVVTFYYFWSRISSVEGCQKAAEALWWIALVILGVGYLFLVIRVPGMYKGGRLRLVLLNPNQLGHYCAITAPIAYWFWAEKTKGKLKKIATLLLGLIGLSLVLSGSRGGLLAAGIAMLLQFFLCYRKRLAIILFLLVFAAAIHFLVAKNQSISSSDDPGFIQENVLREGALATGSGRTYIWKAAWRLVERQPFFGYGFGTVEKLFDKGYFPELAEFQGGHVHNSYIEELVNLGWIGALPIFLALAYVLIGGFLSLKIGPEPTPDYRFYCALYASVLAACISGIFESWFTSVGSIFCFPFWLVVSLMLKMKLHFNSWSKRGVAV